MGFSNELKALTSDLRLLFADDDDDARSQLTTIFEIFFKEVVGCPNGAIALERYKTSDFDLIITDLTMPVMNGQELIAKVREINPKQRIIVITAHNTDENLRSVIEFQVDGILIKPIDRESLTNLLYKVGSDISNERVSSRAASHELRAGEHAICLVVVDMFADIVERFGRQVVPAIFETILEHLELLSIDCSATLDVAEDCLAFSIPHNRVDTVLDILQSFSSSQIFLQVPIGELRINVSLSYGILSTMLEEQSSSSLKRELFSRLNRLLQNVRNDYRNGVSVVKMEIDPELIEHPGEGSMQWLKTTLDALKNDCVVPFYQRVVSCEDPSQTLSVQVLARLKNGEGGYIEPKFFIDLSQKAGILEEITREIAEKSFSSLAGTGLTFHVNLSHFMWKNPGFEAYLAYLCQRHDIASERVILDIDDFFDIDPQSPAAQRLLDLRNEGYKIAAKAYVATAIDLYRFNRFHPTHLKITQELLHRAFDDPEEYRYLSLLMTMASTLKIKTVALGVETEAMLTRVAELGFSCFSGYLIDRPTPTLSGESQS